MLNGVSCKAGCSVIQVMQKSNSNQDESGFKNKCEQQPFKKAKLVHSWPYWDLIFGPINFCRYFLISSPITFIHLPEAKRSKLGIPLKTDFTGKKIVLTLFIVRQKTILVCNLFLQTRRIWGERVLVLGLCLFCVGFASGFSCVPWQCSAMQAKRITCLWLIKMLE